VSKFLNIVDKKELIEDDGWLLIEGDIAENSIPADSREEEHNISSFGIDRAKIKKISGFAQEDLIEMSNFAKLAYYKADKDISKLTKRGYKTFEDYKAAGYTIIPFKGEVVKGSLVDGGHAIGNIFIKDNDIVIAYRGTVSGNDWMSNFDALQAKYPDFAENKGIHKGFCDIFQGSRKAIRDALFLHIADSGLRLEDLNIQFTGHSLGGALAKIAALEMASDPVLGKCIKGIATFGDPRAFDFDAAKLYQDKLGEKTVRISQAYDPVPKVATGFMGYSHVGAQIKIPLLQKIKGIFQGMPHILDGYHLYLSSTSESKLASETKVSFFNSCSKFMQKLLYGSKASFSATKFHAENVLTERAAAQENVLERC
jgi:hypothetical protein